MNGYPEMFRLFRALKKIIFATFEQLTEKIDFGFDFENANDHCATISAETLPDSYFCGPCCFAGTVRE